MDATDCRIESGSNELWQGFRLWREDIRRIADQDQKTLTGSDVALVQAILYWVLAKMGIEDLEASNLTKEFTKKRIS